MPTTALLWLRRDLRLGDNPALAAALAQSERLVPVYIHAPDEEAPWQPGAASRWWLHHSLTALDQQLTALGSRLLIRHGESLDSLRRLVQETGATEVHWNRCYEPALIARDSAIKQALRADGINCTSHNAALLSEPWILKTQNGDPYRVFTPYWRRLEPQLADRSAPCATPDALPSAPSQLHGLSPEALELLPAIPWDQGLQETWQPGEAGARAELARFLNGPIERYHEARDWPAQPGTSRLSPHLHFGEISPRQILARIHQTNASTSTGASPSSGFSSGFGTSTSSGSGSGSSSSSSSSSSSGPSSSSSSGPSSSSSPGSSSGSGSGSDSAFADNAIIEPYLRELGWREFSYQLLYHFPQTPTEPLNPRFADFPWRTDNAEHLLNAWQRGQTGIPIVDAGMRELWHTGWMHNRVRMIVASLLTKNLRLPWQEGAHWFWDTLVDADLANNTQGWQWSAGCGADAAPYFRIFNPVLQGGRFDPQGDYVRRWCPELAKLPDKHIHQPWQAPASLLAECGIRLGQAYPTPIIDLKASRAEALAAYERIKTGSR